MTLLIISICLFVATIILCVIGIFVDCDAKTFSFLIILLVASGLWMITSAGFVKKDIKPIEYPASKYDFKIKVVEFEEHRDTILIVIPKEKSK